MKKRWIVALAALVLVMGTVAAKPKAKTESDSSKIPSYLIVIRNEVERL